MSNPFTDKSIRKILLSSPLQQRAGLTMMRHLILCPRNSRACMYFGHRMGLMMQQATWGKVDLVLLQTHLSSVPLPCHNPPLAKTTLVTKTPLQRLLLLYPLTHHPLPSQPTVAPSVNILLANPLVLCLPFRTPTPMPTTSCLFQMQMFLLAVRPAQAQSDRRLMVHQPSYRLARNSRSLTVLSRTY